jgi:hypothetical protein
MTGWRWFGGLLVLALVPLATFKVPVFAQQDEKEAKLEFKAFNADAKPFYQMLETDTEQNMKVMGQEVTQKQKQTFYIKWTPEKGEGKDLVVKEKIIGVKMNIDIGGNKIAFDSTDEKQSNNPMADFFNALKTLELTLVIDPTTMTVKEVKGQKEFVDKLAQTNPQMQSLLKNILSEDAIKQMAQPTWGAIPKDPVKKDGTWKPKPSTLDLGAIGTYETTFDYTYKGQKDGLDEIGVKTSLQYKAPSGDKKNGQQLPFQIKDRSSLSSKDGTGTVYFSREKGRIEKSTMDMKLEGTLIIEVGNMETSVNLVQSQKSTMTTYDTDPLEKKSTK